MRLALPAIGRTPPYEKMKNPQPPFYFPKVDILINWKSSMMSEGKL
jgi:hypothetical protein